MHLEELTLCTCEEGHDFYVPNDGRVDLEDVNCPICGEMVSTEASRTVLVATTGKDYTKLHELHELYEEAMTKTDILLYGALLESDMYTDGYGSTEEDGELLQKALLKVYDISEDATEEDKLKTEKLLKNDLKALVIEMRGKVTEFVGSGGNG